MRHAAKALACIAVFAAWLWLVVAMEAAREHVRERFDHYQKYERYKP